MIFKGALDYLMQQVAGQEFMNVGTGEIVGEWLDDNSIVTQKE